MSAPTPETDAFVPIDRLFRYLDFVRFDAPRNAIDPYSHEGSYSFADLRLIRDHCQNLERQRDELLTLAERLVFAADAKLLSEKHRVVEEARTAIANAKGGAE